MQDSPHDPDADASLDRLVDAVRSSAPVRRPRRAEGWLDSETRHRIGRSLRVLYAGLLAQPIPERLEALVAELAARSDEETTR